MTGTYPQSHPLSKESQTALAAVVLRLEGESIRQERDPGVRESLDGVRRGLRKVVRRGSRDGASSDKPVTIESPGGFRDALGSVPSEIQALQIVIEAAANEPWITDSVLAKRRKSPIDRDLKEEILADACRALPCDGGAAEFALDEIYPGPMGRLSGLPAKEKVKLATLGAGVTAAAAFTGYLAAPAIGAAIGGLSGLSGAAASSAGLALLGGGSLASGGLGMAGGTMLLSSLAGVGGGGLAAFASLKGVNLRAEIKKLEVLLALCAASSSRETRNAGIEVQMVLEQSISRLLENRISVAANGGSDFSGIDQDINDEVVLLYEVVPEDYRYPVRPA